MSNRIITILVVAFILVIIVGTLLFSYASAYNLGNRSEKRIVAVWTNNKNVLSQYHAKINEMVQVPTMYKDDFKEVITSALSARYGKNGSQAVFGWIKEHQIKYDSTLYTKIQQNIEAGRNKFEENQSLLIDEKRSYETNLGSFWTGTWMRIAGYPKIDLSLYDIVLVESVGEIFKTGVDKPLTLR